MNPLYKEITVGIGPVTILWSKIRQWPEDEVIASAERGHLASIELRILNLLRDKDDVVMIQELLDRFTDDKTSCVDILNAIHGLLARGTITFTGYKELRRV